jgi:hypothetical protein
MTEIAYAIPIVHGKEDLYRQTWDEIAGARRDEYAAALKASRITRQTIWHQQTPDGRTLAIVYIEATDPDAPSASPRLMRTSVGGSCSGCRKYVDAISRSRLFRSSWFTTSASNV